MKSSTQFKFIKILALFGITLSILYFVSCSKSSTPPPPPTNKTSLQAAIDSGNWYNANTVEGTKPGQYTVGSKTALNAAVASATTILNDPTSTQSVLDNATANMQAAINNYHGAYIQQIAAANLIAYWKFNGNANDSSGNGHNGVVTQGHAFFGAGTPNLTADRFGNANKAYHFDKGGNIEVPYNTALNPTTAMSVSLWVRSDTAKRAVNDANRYMIAMNRWNGWKFQTQPSLPFFTVHVVRPNHVPVDSTIWDRDDAGHPLASATTWYHLVATYKDGEEDFYINGTQVKSWTDVTGTPLSISNNAVNITIGSDLPTSKYLTTDATGNFLVDYGGFWSGDMDDVMFYNIALSAPQVLSIYNDQATQ